MGIVSEFTFKNFPYLNYFLFYSLYIFSFITYYFLHLKNHHSFNWEEIWNDFYDGTRGFLFRFFFFSLIFYILERTNWSELYRGNRFSRYEIPYTIFAVMIYILLADYIRYWTHRWMHEWDWAYPFFHSAHHESKTVTPATAMAIPPIGMNLTFSISPILLTPFIPISILGFFIVNFLLQFQIILCHFGYELVPERIRSLPLFRHIYFYTEHIEHHREELSLYGTFFKMWDRWHGTESTQLLQKRA